MHTIIMVTAGIVLFGVFMVIARSVDRLSGSTALKAFLLVWLVISLANLSVGVFRAGYTVLEELPILLVVFGIPAAVALITHQSVRIKKPVK